jgi:hypothetical protein
LAEEEVNGVVWEGFGSGFGAGFEDVDVRIWAEGLHADGSLSFEENADVSLAVIDAAAAAAADDDDDWAIWSALAEAARWAGICWPGSKRRRSSRRRDEEGREREAPVSLKKTKQEAGSADEDMVW